MKIKSVTPVGKKKVYDLSVDVVQHYVLENGVVSHNTGPMYSSDTVIILGKQQEKDGKDLVGFNFIMNIEKSRYVRERAKIPLQVTFEGGVNPYSGLMDIACDIGWVHRPNNRSYQIVLDITEDGEMIIDETKWYRKDTDCAEFWRPLIKNPKFRQAVHDHFAVSVVDSSSLENEAKSLFEDDADIDVPVIDQPEN